MRLRYLHLQDVPPLQNIAIKFLHEDLLGRDCSIRFVVGVNGSGKTRLLRALTEVFVRLERSTNLKLPFPITLAYDVGRGEAAHSIYLHYPGKLQGSRFAIFDDVLPMETNWEDQNKLNLDELPDGHLYRDGSLPGVSTMIANMPKALIAYTSGNPVLWRSIFSIPSDDLNVAFDAEAEERPIGWRYTDESVLQASEALELISKEDTEIAPLASLRSTTAFLVTEENLNLVVVAVTLLEAIKDLELNPLPDERQQFAEHVRKDKLRGNHRGLRGLLSEVDWLWPVTISLEILLDFDLIKNVRSRNQLRQLYGAATSVIRQPEPSKLRLLTYDLQRPITENGSRSIKTKIITARRLAEILTEGQPSSSAFALYRSLQQLQQQGILRGLKIGLKKSNLNELLLYDWLSDGEQEFLGRMALFHLLHDQDDALVILDEPETHFNDLWKRRIVDIIDDSLRNNVSEVVISTHSSIALTDVFETEITLLEKRDSNASVAVKQHPTKTFGALPSEIMTDIFGAPDVVGQRAMEFLDLVLLIIGYPDDARAIWEMMPLRDQNLQTNKPLERLYGRMSELPHDYGDETEAKVRLHSIFQSLRNYTQRKLQRDEVTILEAIQVLRDRLGQGHYEFEFRRRLRAIERD